MEEEGEEEEEEEEEGPGSPELRPPLQAHVAAAFSEPNNGQEGFTEGSQHRTHCNRESCSCTADN